MSQTTRYAIELEPGKYVSNCDDSDTHAAEMFTEHDVNKMLPSYKQHWPHARIVPVKCEVVDD